MTTWIVLLGPLVVWLTHFLSIYISAEFAPSALPFLTPIFTPCAFILLAVLFLRDRDLAQWQTIMVQGGVLVSAIAVTWQTLAIYL